jgi:hypothetical protein
MAVDVTVGEYQSQVIPKVVRENSLYWLHNHIELNKERLFKELVSNKDLEDGEVICQFSISFFFFCSCVV